MLGGVCALSQARPLLRRAAGRASYGAVIRLSNPRASISQKSLVYLNRSGGSVSAHVSAHQSARKLSGNVSHTIVTSSPPVAYWLFGCAGLVGAMVAVGGITRLTRSGLSMVDWKPQGRLPPMTREEWESEFEKYKQFPEFRQRTNMSLEDFKFIFWWEYGHRMLGRGLGLAFLGPWAYFALKKRIPQHIKGNLLALAALGATQGAIGWWMVRSGLKEFPEDYKREIRVSPYRLATHLGFAFTTLGLLVWTGFEALTPQSLHVFNRDAMDKIALQGATKVRGLAKVGAAALAVTVISGAFVAGIDAGRAYNTWPKMDGNWMPEGMLELEPKYRNFFENTATVQFDHRTLAYTTTAISTAILLTARKPHVWNQLPPKARAAINAMAAMTGVQVLLGISTLLTYVPTSLGAAHQVGALVLLSKYMWVLHSLKYLKP